MTEYIVTCDEETASWIGNDVESMRLLVRCRDCTWLVETSNPISSTGWWCVPNDTPRELDGFCNWAIRRAD